MGLILNVLTGAGLLGGARAFAVALQGRPLFQKLGGYYMWTATGGILGFGYYNLRQNVIQKIDARYEELVEQRNNRKSSS
ncbi:hypothetical protein BB559_007002 [Furculomyces boomerangus]|uniref:Uncharacterized protein n=2 Tax=Harpellales TaxID=61421 RepID=A0A2T9XZF3_9FUNG|nr:hypothetical protein BB559_007002 [Furculomyces boomerangus]PWA01234.1 hypothetical protein BB558_002679 [Smittium angustum]